MSGEDNKTEISASLQEILLNFSVWVIASILVSTLPSFAEIGYYYFFEDKNFTASIKEINLVNLSVNLYLASIVISFTNIWEQSNVLVKDLKNDQKQNYLHYLSYILINLITIVVSSMFFVFSITFGINKNDEINIQTFLPQELTLVFSANILILFSLITKLLIDFRYLTASEVKKVNKYLGAFCAFLYWLFNFNILENINNILSNFRDGRLLEGLEGTFSIFAGSAIALMLIFIVFVILLTIISILTGGLNKKEPQNKSEDSKTLTLPTKKNKISNTNKIDNKKNI